MSSFLKKVLDLFRSIFKKPTPPPDPEPNPDPEPEPDPTVIAAIRSLPDSYCNEVETWTKIQVTPTDKTVCWAIEDAPPSGWTPSKLDHGGAWDSVNKKMKWGPFFESKPKTLHAKLIPVGDGPVSFSGVVSEDGKSYPIQGDSTVSA